MFETFVQPFAGFVFKFEVNTKLAEFSHKEHEVEFQPSSVGCIASV